MVERGNKGKPPAALPQFETDPLVATETRANPPPAHCRRPRGSPEAPEAPDMTQAEGGGSLPRILLASGEWMGQNSRG